MRSGISRRDFVRSLAIGSAGALLAGCYVETEQPFAVDPDPVSQTQAPARGGPRRGGTLRVVRLTAVDSLDPHIGRYHEDGRNLLYDSMLQLHWVDRDTGTFEIRPGLAESYETPDATTIILNLRRDVRFHDGSTFDAEVAKWNFDRALTHPESTAKALLSDIEEVVVQGPYTLRLNLSKPGPLIPLLLTPANADTLNIVSREAYESMGEEAFGQEPVGTGPFKLREWVRDDRIVMDRFADHWDMGQDGQPLPYLDAYLGRLILDQTVALVELRTGNMDIGPLLMQDVDTVEADPNVGIYTGIGGWSGQPSIYFNSNPPPGADYPFSRSKELRHAVQYATDREALARTLGFGVSHAHYYWGSYPGMVGYDLTERTVPRFEYDLERAKQLVIDAGYPNGVDVEVKVINRPTDVQPLEVVQPMWAAAGIRMQINLMDRVAWIDDGRSGNWQALSHGNGPPFEPLLRSESKTGSTFNWAIYSNPAVDALWDQASTEYDLDRRAELYRDITAILVDDAYHFIGYRRPDLSCIGRRVMDMEMPYNRRRVWLTE